MAFVKKIGFIKIAYLNEADKSDVNNTLRVFGITLFNNFYLSLTWVYAPIKIGSMTRDAKKHKEWYEGLRNARPDN